MTFSSKKLPLSVCIIARNEAKDLERCLTSVVDIAKEIIVVINDCTDNTREVAEHFHAFVVEHAWEGYAKQKNFAYTLAHEPWILRLDADEAFSPELKRSLYNFLSSSDESKDITVGICSRKNRYLGHWLNRQKDKCPILLKKDAVHWSGNVHEKLCFSGKTTFLKGDLLHYTEKNVQHSLNKQIHYAKIAAESIAQKYSCQQIAFRAFTNPLAKFLKFYFLKLGFLDGIPGLYFAVTNAYYTFIKYILAFEKMLPSDKHTS